MLAVHECDNDTLIKRAIKRLPTMNDVDRITSIVGKRVIVKNMWHGVVVGHNASPYGAFPGRFYPVNVKLDVDWQGRTNKTHSYKFEDITLE